ncbi:YbfB/YjiJ family MFS transporter [Pseudomonas resinovorans]|uniref:YbfB/YjiJ family MFS transporter n=1 Tax=Metapseudomonas resinovorans TaxID=53412 RepID=UPI00237F6D75|nr:YbfB/YjiJ family MFS transporter [Pseudomonas resinovorans]MDE3739748.1 YbfB/YjiJ family MFS transporter [Pseudomonas resinovorans]
MPTLIRLFACFLALLVAMGVGRFALTPQLPHLIAEGQVSLTGAGLVAAANYLGYLIGALDAFNVRSPGQARLRLVIGLWATALLTLASVPAEGLWPHVLLRFALGVASAWVLVVVTGLSQRIAADANRPRLGSLVFAGPAFGVMLTGLLALQLNLQGQGSAALWLAFGALALVLTLLTQPLLPSAPTAAPQMETPTRARPKAFYALLVAYGLVGLGYIIPATFLSQMAAARFHGQWQADLFWPAFGLAAALGVVLVSLRRRSPGGTRRWMVVALWLQALGTLACTLPGMAGLTLGVILSGGPFLAGMQLVMQYARELDPHGHSRNVGLLTAAFALGQLLGPLLAAVSSHLGGSLQPALYLAGAGLVLAGGLMARPGANPVGASSFAKQAETEWDPAP